jgi:uncharacterized RDD family membrane protein YckC
MATLHDRGDDLPLVLASRWQRFFNRIIDGAGVMLVGALLGFVLGAAFAAADQQDALRALTHPGMLAELGFGIGSAVLYYTCFEALFGCTLGKLVTGTRVVDERGGPITWGQAFGRSLCRYIPFEPFSVLGSEDDEVRGWHDRIPRTFVVRRRGVVRTARTGVVDA